MRKLRLLPLLYLLICLSVVGRAQTATTTTVSGIVSDAHGARIVAALVTLTDTATNHERNTLTDAEGRYSFYAVPPGQFRLRVEAQGFKTTEVSEVPTEVSKVTTISIT